MRLLSTQSFAVTRPVQQGEAMPPARKSATRKPAARASRATQGVRARAASTKQATRREVEQSIARFEKRLDDANDALKALGGHLGRGSQRSYKEVTAALAALRREAAKTNKQALKDFDSVKAALTQKLPAKASSTARKSSSRAQRSRRPRPRRPRPDPSAPARAPPLPARRPRARPAPARPPAAPPRRARPRHVRRERVRNQRARRRPASSCARALRSRLERHPSFDLRRLLGLKLHGATHTHALAERDVTVYDEPFRLPQ